MTRDEIRELAERYAARYTDENGRLNLNRLCRGEGVHVFTYSQAEKILKKLHIDRFMKENDGFTFAKMIFFDNTQTLERQRYTIAHELGHILIGHITGAPSDYADAELEADAFAFNLLSPLRKEREAVC